MKQNNLTIQVCSRKSPYLALDLSYIDHWGSKKDRVSERIEGIGLLLEVSLLAGQITNSDTSDIVDVKKNVLEVGIRVVW